MNELNMSRPSEDNIDNITEYIKVMLGTPRINDDTLFPLTAIYLFFLVIGLLGNLATCIGILSYSSIENYF